MFYLIKTAGELTSPSKLRHQAIFMVGTGGSGKSFVANKKYLKYLPKGVSDRQTASEEERNLSQINFSKIEEALKKLGVTVSESSKASIPFVLTNEYGVVIPRELWESRLPPATFEKVKKLENIVFSSPKHEVPSFFRQVNPDVYKEELEGYDENRPELVHEMSSTMSKAYFESVLDTGDPFIVDGTGVNFNKTALWMKRALESGYRITFLYVRVPLVISLIRNSLRARKVNPKVLLNQFRELEINIPKYVQFLKSFPKKKTKISIVDTSNPNDVKNFMGNCKQINSFFAETTDYSSLSEFLKGELPEALNASINGVKWGKILESCGT
jgi:predicted kinase